MCTKISIELSINMGLIDGQEKILGNLVTAETLKTHLDHPGMKEHQGVVKMAAIDNRVARALLKKIFEKMMRRRFLLNWLSNLTMIKHLITQISIR
jgi:hypothetical protein